MGDFMDKVRSPILGCIMYFGPLAGFGCVHTQIDPLGPDGCLNGDGRFPTQGVSCSETRLDGLVDCPLLTRLPQMVDYSFLTRSIPLVASTSMWLAIHSGVSFVH